MRRWFVLAALVLAPVTGWCSDIRILFDLDSYEDDACVTPMVPLRAYVVAFLGADVAAGGIQGAELRIVGYDSSWFNAVFPNPSANFFLGNPLGDGGQIAFENCQVQQGPTPILLYTIDTVVLQEITPTTLRVVQHNTPSNPNFSCPRFALCDPPTYTAICAGSADASLTPCVVPVNATTWTAVRALYR